MCESLRRDWSPQMPSIFQALGDPSPALRRAPRICLPRASRDLVEQAQTAQAPQQRRQLAAMPQPDPLPDLAIAHARVGGHIQEALPRAEGTGVTQRSRQRIAG